MAENEQRGQRRLDDMSAEQRFEMTLFELVRALPYVQRSRNMFPAIPTALTADDYRAWRAEFMSAIEDCPPDQHMVALTWDELVAQLRVRGGDHTSPTWSVFDLPPGTDRARVCLSGENAVVFEAVRERRGFGCRLLALLARMCPWRPSQ